MKFIKERCGLCGTCIGVCPQCSLELAENIAIIDDEKCDNCGRCAIVCPLGAFIGVKNEI